MTRLLKRGGPRLHINYIWQLMNNNYEVFLIICYKLYCDFELEINFVHELKALVIKCGNHSYSNIKGHVIKQLQSDAAIKGYSLKNLVTPLIMRKCGACKILIFTLYNIYLSAIYRFDANTENGSSIYFSFVCGHFDNSGFLNCVLRKYITTIIISVSCNIDFIISISCNIVAPDSV